MTVNPANKGGAVTDQILGMNVANWFDSTTAGIATKLQSAGIKAVRWPGGSESDIFHWQTNSIACGSGYVSPNSTFQDFLTNIAIPANVDVAVSVNYGSKADCSDGGDPAEAAAWVTAALNSGNKVSHWTVGNEVYGGWEVDKHKTPHDPATYAAAVKNGFYPQMKAANSNALVGVVVEPRYTWDAVVLANAPYDFVEYHYYGQDTPGQESDSYLVTQAAQVLTRQINTIKTELKTAGHPNTPIFVGELGSVSYNPGKQTTSITQALYAGQVLGELMNAGVARATWWLAFGGCSDSGIGNFSSSLYGWQNFGGYMLFSDGTPEGSCPNATTVPYGTPLPTARAFQLFSGVAKTGENVLTAAVTGDQADVRAYAATHSGGTVLVLFNLNQSAAKSVNVTLTGVASSSAVSVSTYDKALYDQSKTNVWAAPTTTALGTQDLPLKLTLTPWSMNVVTLGK